jgi:hypothetical protein
MRQDGGVTAEAISEKNNGIIYTRRHRAAFSSALDAYLWHGVISLAEREAGEKFYREYARSVLKIRIYDYSAGAHADNEMAAISAINGNVLLKSAFDLLSNPQREVVISVCVENRSAGTTRRVSALRKGLGILARHWKLLGESRE